MRKTGYYVIPNTGKKNWVSWHFTVDDSEAIRCSGRLLVHCEPAAARASETIFALSHLLSTHTTSTMKPSDAFLGVIDFISTLIPGAIGVFFVMDPTWLPRPVTWSLERGSPESWAVFLVSAYVLGHVIGSVASLVLDPLYDRVYARWRRAGSEYARRGSDAPATRRGGIAQRVRYISDAVGPEDELLHIAKVIKRTQLGDVVDGSGIAADSVSDTFWWAGTVLRLQGSSGPVEIDALTAQSKLFRSLVVLVPLIACRIGFTEPGIAIALPVFLLLALWRFLTLRWATTERTYEYFIAAHVLPHTLVSPSGRSVPRTSI